MGRGVNVSDFIRQTKGFSSENKRSADLVSEVSEKVSLDRSKISKFENENRNSSEWAGLSTLKGVNQGLRDECQSCAEKIRKNAEKQKDDYRYIWETIIATKRGVPDFLNKHGLGQYIPSLTGIGYEEVEDLIDAEIKTDGDLADDRCWVVFDDERLQMARHHLRILRQEVNNLRKRIANIPHRMKNIISSADEAARTSNRFLEACKDSVNRARSLENETRTAAAREARQRQASEAAAAIAGTAAAVTGFGALTFGVAATAAVALTGGLALPFVAAAGGAAIGTAAAGTVAVGAGLLSLLTPAADLVSSSAISSDTFGEQVIDNLKDHQRKMGEKARDLERQWLNEIHTCVTMMESNSAAVKHKLVSLPSSVSSIRSDFDTIFENIDTLQSKAKKYEAGSASASGLGSSRPCPYCGHSPCLYGNTWN